MAIIRVTDRPPTCEECGATYTEHARDCKAGAQAALDLVAMLLGLAALATLPRIKNGPLIPLVVHTRADDLLEPCRCSMCKSARAQQERATAEGD